MKRWLLVCIMVAALSSCASVSVQPVITTPDTKKKPSTRKETRSSSAINLNDACNIYRKKPRWLDGSFRASKKWQVPLFVMLAIVHQESHFVATARPLNPNKNSKKKYASSAFGYAQALDGTWKEYQQNTGNTLGRRDDFSSAVDFIGWYVLSAHKRNRVSKWATDQIYLNYHEGMGGYRKKTYLRKPWLIKVADKVKRRGAMYATQLKDCGIPLFIDSKDKIPKVHFPNTSQDNRETNPAPVKNKNTEVLEKEFRKILRSKGVWF